MTRLTKILFTLLLTLTPFFGAQARVSDADFNRIVADHKIHYSQKYDDEACYVRIEDEVTCPEDNKKKFLVVTGEELLEQNEEAKISLYFINNKDTVLLLDVRNGDGLVDDEGNLSLTSHNVESSINQLWVSNESQDVTSFADDFLLNYLGHALDFSGFDMATEIGDNFLAKSSFLKYIDLSPFHNVTSLGDNFLYRCTLTSLDLSPLSNVESIGTWFLGGNKFTSLDLSPLVNISSMGSHCLENNLELDSLKLLSFRQYLIITLECQKYLLERKPYLILDYIKEAADAGYCEELMELIMIYWHGMGYIQPPNKRLAAYYCRLAIQQGLMPAQLMMLIVTQR